MEGEDRVDNRTEQLAEGVWRIEATSWVNVFLVANDGGGDAEGLTLIDTGTRSSGPRIVRSVRMLGFDPRAIRDVLLTHWHFDHTGSAARFASSSAGSAVHVGAGDLDVVAGRVDRPHRQVPRGWVTRLGRGLDAIGLFRPAAAVPDAMPLEHGRRLPCAGGLEVIAAPGHTPGHCAFLLPERGVLLAGDAIWNYWRLSPGLRTSCSALPAVPDTLRRLAGCRFDVLGVAHGAAVTERAEERVAALVP
jgi:glyoxylase-like metal-dependent hydrolase (beta-lactamase superfamily II)